MQLGVRHSPQFPLCQKCFKTVFKSPDESHAALILDLKEWDERVLDCKIHFSSLPACMWCFKGRLLSSFLRVPVIFPSTCFADVRAWRFKLFESFPCKCLWVFSHFYISCFPAASLCLFQVFSFTVWATLHPIHHSQCLSHFSPLLHSPPFISHQQSLTACQCLKCQFLLYFRKTCN